MLGLALHRKYSVAFPMHIGTLGNDVTRDRRVQTHGADFIMQTARHMRLGMFCKFLIRWKELRKPGCLVASLHAMRINDAIPPFQTCLKPPRFFAMFLNGSRIRQAPIAKLGNQQWQVEATFPFIFGIPNRAAAFGKFTHPLIPFIGMVWDGAVVMKVFEVAGNMGIAEAGRVIYDQTRGIKRLSLAVKICQPLAMLR